MLFSSDHLLECTVHRIFSNNSTVWRLREDYLVSAQSPIVAYSSIRACSGTVKPCLSDGISFLTFCWINEVAGLTNPGLEAGSRTHDAHVHMYIKMKHF